MMQQASDTVAVLGAHAPTRGAVIAIFMAAVFLSFLLTLWLGYRGFKQFSPETKKWMAGFFEQGSTQSSTRLVGILSFFMAVLMASVVIIAMLVGSWLGVNELAAPSGAMAGLVGVLIGMLFANACVALGLRKPGEASGDAPAGSAPAASEGGA